MRKVPEVLMLDSLGLSKSEINGRRDSRAARCASAWSLRRPRARCLAGARRH
jgi:hypothetical protein